MIMKLIWGRPWARHVRSELFDEPLFVSITAVFTWYSFGLSFAEHLQRLQLFAVQNNLLEIA